METKVRACIKKGRIIYSDEIYFEVLFKDGRKKFYKENSSKYVSLRPTGDLYVNYVFRGDLGENEIVSTRMGELLYKSK